MSPWEVDIEFKKSDYDYVRVLITNNDWSSYQTWAISTVQQSGMPKEFAITIANRYVPEPPRDSIVVAIQNA